MLRDAYVSISEIQHMKVLPAAKSKCGLSDNDQFDSCVEYVGEDKDTTCVVSIFY